MEPRFDPKDVRTPIQLTAAWFVTLAALVGALLAASNHAGDAWLRGFFGIAAVAVIPIFVVAVFRLQTKYRPQLLADEYFVQVEQEVQATATNRGIELSPAQPEAIARRAARNYRALVGASILWVDDNPASVRQEQQL